MTHKTDIKIRGLVHSFVKRNRIIKTTFTEVGVTSTVDPQNKVGETRFLKLSGEHAMKKRACIEELECWMASSSQTP